jgi:predicted Zn finger-like uncharacterized protein
MAKIVCPNADCRMVSDLPDEYLGRQVACKHCKQVFVATAVGGAKPSETKTLLADNAPASAGGSVEALCPTCGAVFNLKSDYLGKKVRCKKCEHVFTVGGEAKPRSDDDGAGVQSRPGAVAKKSARDEDDDDRVSSRKDRAAARRGRDDDDDDDRPRRKAAGRGRDDDDDDDDDRGRKRKRTYHDDDDDDDDDAPRRRPARSSSGGGTGLILGIVGGVVFLVLLICGGIFYVFYSVANEVDDAVAQAQQNANNGFGPDFGGFPGFEQQPKDMAEALAFLKGNDGNQKRGAGTWLSRQPLDPARQKEVAAALEPLVNDPDDNICASGAKALRVWGTKDNGPALTRALKLRLPDGNRVFLDASQTELMQAIAAVKYDPGADVVVQFLPNAFTGGEADKALALHGAGAEKAVVKYFDHTDGGARGKARALLLRYNTKPGVILDQVVVDLGAVEQETTKQAIEWLAQPASDDALKVANAEPARRTAVALALNRNITSPPPWSEDNVLRAVKRWGTKDNVTALIGFLRSNGHKRRDTADALIAIGPACEAEVKKLLTDTDGGVVNEAKRIIATVGSKESRFEGLLVDLRSDNAGRIKEAARMLQGMPADDKQRAEVVAALVGTLSNTGPGRTDNDCAEDVARALVVWATKDDAGAIGDKLRDSTKPFTRRTRAHLIEWMGQKKAEKGIPFLAASLAERDDYQSASKALQAMGPELGDKIEVEVQKVQTNDRLQIAEAFKVLGAVGTKKCVPFLKQQQAIFAQKKDVVLATAAAQAAAACEKR